LVVLAHLRRRWNLSGREGFGVLSPSRRACERGIQARDSGVFEEMKCLFSITPEVRKGGKSPECLSLKNSNRTRSRVDLRVRLVQTAGRDTRVKVADRRVRSLAELKRLITHLVGSACLSADRTWWRVRSRMTGRVRSREALAGLPSDTQCSASGHGNGSL
jgi:hypothetical protein